MKHSMRRYAKNKQIKINKDNISFRLKYFNDEKNATESEDKKPATSVKTAPHANTVNWLYDGIKTMAKENLLFTDDVAVLSDLVSDLAAMLKEAEPKISDADIDSMIASL